MTDSFINPYYNTVPTFLKEKLSTPILLIIFHYTFVLPVSKRRVITFPKFVKNKSKCFFDKLIEIEKLSRYRSS